MTEERALYTTDEVMQMRVRIELQRKQLDEMKGLRTENELLRERVEALRKTIDGFTDASNFQWAQYQARIKEYEAAVERLEADNRRLRHLDSMPVDALIRYIVNSQYNETLGKQNGCSYLQFFEDAGAIQDFIFTLDGDA